jgi:hypothetical protein
MRTEEQLKKSKEMWEKLKVEAQADIDNADMYIEAIERKLCEFKKE